MNIILYTLPIAIICYNLYLILIFSKLIITKYNNKLLYEKEDDYNDVIQMYKYKTTINNKKNLKIINSIVGAENMLL